MRSPISCLLTVLLIVACQSTPAGDRPNRYDSDHITQQELQELENVLVLTARQAIRRLRPTWLRPRSSTVGGRHTPVVFRDGIKMGDLTTLDEMDMREIMEFRYLSASDATNRYGTGYPGGVILVFTKRAG